MGISSKIRLLTAFGLALFFKIAIYSQPVENPISNTDTIVVYMIHGQGSDCRLFDRIELQPPFIKVCLPCPMPEAGTPMRDYAAFFLPLIDSNRTFCLVGVSLGGMVCTELSTMLHPAATIVISSATSRNELPAKFRVMNYVFLPKLVPSGLYKTGAKVVQPWVEPDRNNYKDAFVAMLNDKEGLFLKRTTEMIVGWERVVAPDGIIHIHGNADHTLPIKNVRYDYLIEGGSHMMVYTRAEDISPLLNRLLHQHLD